MDNNLKCAQLRSAELLEAIQSQEVAILAKLQEGARLESIAGMEVALAALVAEADDAATIMQYYQRIGEMQREGDIYKLVLQVDRVPSGDAGSGSADGDGDAALSAACVKWSDLCPSETVSISGLLIATRGVVFAVLEGEEAAVKRMVSEVLGADTKAIVPATMMVLHTSRAYARLYPIGIKLRYVEDGTMDAVLTKCREVIALGACFAPQQSVDVAVRGGNPSTEVIANAAGVPLLLVTIAYRHGVVHSTAVYHQLAMCVEGLIRPLGGRVLEGFGEHMIIAFDRRGKWPANPLLEVSAQLLQQTEGIVTMAPSASSGGDAAKGVTAPAAPRVRCPMAPHDLHVVAHMGDVTYVNGPHLQAYGEGIRQLKALAYVAEASQRPMLISPIVLLHCSRAMYRTVPFSHNTIGYHTFAGMELTRSIQLPEPFRIEAPQGAKVVQQQGSNTVKIVPSTRDELRAAAAAAAPVTGEDSQAEEFKAYFRGLDPQQNGWITKSTLRTFLLSNEAFVIFPHDAPRIDGWIEEANSLGPERISLDEFLFLCVRLRQL